MKEEGQRGCSGVQREGKCGEGFKEETICGGGGEELNQAEMMGEHV